MVGDERLITYGETFEAEPTEACGSKVIGSYDLHSGELVFKMR